MRILAIGLIGAALLGGCGSDDTENAEELTVVATQSGAPAVTASVTAELPQNIAFDRLQNIGASIAFGDTTGQLVDYGDRFAGSVGLAVDDASTEQWSAQLFEIYNGEWITLAYANGTRSGSSVTITDDQWDFAIDLDGDGNNNIDERLAGSSPYDPASTTSNPQGRWSAGALSELRVLVDIPALGSGERLSTAARVSLDGREQGTLLLNGIQSTTLYTDLVPLKNYPLSVEILAWSEGGNVSLARVEKNIWISAGLNRIRIKADEFTSNIDDDNDQLTNLQEYIALRGQGLNPTTITSISAAEAPQIDGSLTDAVWTSRFTASGGISTGVIDTVIVETPESAIDYDYLPEWSAVHDNEYLYIATRVVDNRPQSDSAPQWWHDDSIEMYFDGNHSRQSEYDGEDDLQLVFTTDSTVNKGVNSVEIPAGLEFVVSSAQFQRDMLNEFSALASDGYNLELRVPLAEIGITIGELAGFNIQVNDDANGGVRDTKLGWVGVMGKDRSWESPEVFGAVRAE